MCLRNLLQWSWTRITWENNKQQWLHGPPRRQHDTTLKHITVCAALTDRSILFLQKFQDIEENHVHHMKVIIQSYSQSVEETHVQIGEVSPHTHTHIFKQSFDWSKCLIERCHIYRSDQVNYSTQLFCLTADYASLKPLFQPLITTVLIHLNMEETHFFIQKKITSDLCSQDCVVVAPAVKLFNQQQRAT